MTCYVAYIYNTMPNVEEYSFIYHDKTSTYIFVSLKHGFFIDIDNLNPNRKFILTLTCNT